MCKLCDFYDQKYLTVDFPPKNCQGVFFSINCVGFFVPHDRSILAGTKDLAPVFGHETSASLVCTNFANKCTTVVLPVDMRRKGEDGLGQFGLSKFACKAPTNRQF